MQTLISVIIALIIFSLLVLIHEFGHFIVAKKNGVFVNEFSIGMGPRIFSKVAKSGTRYSVKILPLGGSCAMLGEDEDNDEEGSFNSKSLGARMAIVFAGPFFNFILAFLLSIVVIGFVGTDISYVTQVDKNSAAYTAGLREGDQILKYNGASIGIGRELYIEQYVNPLDGDEVSITYKRDGKKNTIKFTPDYVEKYLVGMTYSSGNTPAEISAVTKGAAMDEAGVIMGDIVTAINSTPIASGEEMMAYIEAHPFGNEEVNITLNRDGKEINVTAKPTMTKVYGTGFVYNLLREKQSVGGVMKYSLIELRYQITSVLKSLKMMVTGQVSANEVSGPVGIVNLIGDTYQETKSEGLGVTLLTLINMAIMLSANLGVMNLLPIPALDGGRLFLYIIELIRRKPIPRDKEGMIHFIGFVLLMALMIFLVFNDIRKLF